MTRKVNNNTYENGDLSAIGGNSLTFAYREMINVAASAVGLLATKATVGGVISGVCKSVLTTASDNQTVAQRKINYEPVNAKNVYRMTITGGTITVADEGKFYDLATSTTVDGTTESGSTGQLKLVKFVKATECDFVIANA